MFEQIDRYVARYLKLDEEECAFFHSLLKHRHVDRKSFLLREGEVCNFEAFIIKGCIRTYFMDRDGHETILLFAVENWWVSDLASFSEQTPSRLFIEALEDSEVLLIDHDRKEELFRRIPPFERLFRILVQRSLTELQCRYLDSVSKPAKERYRSFVAKYPHILQRVPQHQIAKYLGISPEFLSKIRNELLHNSGA